MKKHWCSLRVGKRLLGNKATIILEFLWQWRRRIFLNSLGRDTYLLIAGYLAFYLKTCMWKIASWQSGINTGKIQRERLYSSRAWFIEGQLTETNSCSPIFRNINTKQFCQHVKVNLFFKVVSYLFWFAISFFVVRIWLQQLKHAVTIQLRAPKSIQNLLWQEKVSAKGKYWEG